MVRVWMSLNLKKDLQLTLIPFDQTTCDEFRQSPCMFALLPEESAIMWL